VENAPEFDPAIKERDDPVKERNQQSLPLFCPSQDLGVAVLSPSYKPACLLLIMNLFFSLPDYSRFLHMAGFDRVSL